MKVSHFVAFHDQEPSVSLLHYKINALLKSPRHTVVDCATETKAFANKY